MNGLSVDGGSFEIDLPLRRGWHLSVFRLTQPVPKYLRSTIGFGIIFAVIAVVTRLFERFLGTLNELTSKVQRRQARPMRVSSLSFNMTAPHF
jgi:hypothetical protein